MVTQHDPFLPEPERWNSSAIASAEDGGAPNRRAPNYALWLFYLYLRPRTFFREFVVEHLWFTTIVAALLFGLSNAIERVESRAMMSAPSASARWSVQSWENYAVIVLVGGVFSAALFYVLGGWWYRVRLVWSGATNPDRVLARRVYVYASTVHALPAVLTAVWEAASYPTPSEAIKAAGSLWHIALAMFPVWSVVVSFIGVRTVFNVRGFRPALWFLILPCAIYAVVFVGAFIAALPSASPPQIASPRSYAGSHITMSLPGDWNVNSADPDYDPAQYLPIDMPQDAYLEIFLENEHDEPQQLVESAIASMADASSRSTPGPAFSRWGSFEGVGREHTIVFDETAVVVRVFATRVPDGRVLIINETFSPDDRALLKPGFELVANSLTIRPAVNVSPSR